MKIGITEARKKFGELLDRVGQGEEIIITRHGRAVARLVPSTPRVDRDEVQAAFDRIRERARRLHQTKPGAKPAPFDWPSWKKLRDKGRP